MMTDEAPAQLSQKQREKLRAAYLESWRARLQGVLTAEWMSSADIARALGETNAKVRERLADLVKDGGAQRGVQQRPYRRKSTADGPFYAYFRLNVSGKMPSLPEIPVEAPAWPSRRRLSRANSAIANAPRPVARNTVPVALPRLADSSVLDALGPAVLEVSIGLTAIDRRDIVARYDEFGNVDARYDRRLLAACGKRLGRPLTPAEKHLMRRAYVTLAGWSPARRG